jgi:hypothetical protein
MSWPGFFYKALHADVLVLLDNVQFPLGTSWVNRNRLKNAKGTFWLTVPVWKKGKGKQLIKEVEICNERDWQKKHYQSFIHAYKNAPYFMDHLVFFSKIYKKKWNKLLELNLTILDYLLDALGIKVETILSSSLGLNSKATELLVQVCKKLNATSYITISMAKSHIKEELFLAHGINVKYLKFKPPVYPQLWGDFLSNLSVLDLLLICGPMSLNIIKQV